MDYHKIFEGSFIESQRIISILQEHHIEPIVKNHFQQASGAGFGAVYGDFVQIYVHSDELDKAKALILL